jgi:hypothetical protein
MQAKEEAKYNCYVMYFTVYLDIPVKSLKQRGIVTTYYYYITGGTELLSPHYHYLTSLHCDFRANIVGAKL